MGFCHNFELTGKMCFENGNVIKSCRGEKNDDTIKNAIS